MSDNTAYETLGALRELTADLPDDTRIEVYIRMDDDPDHFYGPEWVEAGSSVDLISEPPTLTLHIWEPRDWPANAFAEVTQERAQMLADIDAADEDD
jgi:hypothetical protein